MECKGCSLEDVDNCRFFGEDRCNFAPVEPLTSDGPVERLVMPFGMTKVPVGWPMMGQAFIDFALFAIKQEEIVRQFEGHSGIAISRILPHSPIEKMIDDSLGRNTEAEIQEAFSKFLDWLVVIMWGEA